MHSSLGLRLKNSEHVINSLYSYNNSMAELWNFGASVSSIEKLISFHQTLLFQPLLDQPLANKHMYQRLI